jgi:hypothetical protein
MGRDTRVKLWWRVPFPPWGRATATLGFVALLASACGGSSKPHRPTDVPYVSEAASFDVHALGDGAILEIRLGYDGRQPLAVQHVRLNLPSGLSGQFLGFANCHHGCVGGAPATASYLAQAERAVTNKDSITFPAARDPNNTGSNVDFTAEVVLRLETDTAVKTVGSGGCVTVPSLTMESGKSTFAVELFGGGWVAALSGGSRCSGI